MFKFEQLLKLAERSIWSTLCPNVLVTAEPLDSLDLDPLYSLDYDSTFGIMSPMLYQLVGHPYTLSPAPEDLGREQQWHLGCSSS